jgi:small-conductance mechanosensitive channel
MLDDSFFNNPVRDWLTALAIAIGTFLILRFAKAIIKKVLTRRQAPGAAPGWQDLPLALTEGIHTLFIALLAIYAGTFRLSFPGEASIYIHRVLFVVVLLQAGVMGSRVIRFMIDRYKRQKMETNPAAVTMTTAMGFLLKMVLWMVLLLVALDNFGFNITALVAGFGVGGIAVALAIQNLLGDLFASFTIVFDKPFLIGDFIIVGDFMGTVEHIGLKTTRIRSISGEQLIFPNGDLLQSRVRNFKRMYERRVVFAIGVLYQTTLEQLKEIPGIIRAAVEAQAQVRFDRAHFKAYGAYSLDFEVVYYVLVPDYAVYMDIQQAINLILFKEFEERNIQFAYPTRTVFVENG